MLRSLTFIPRAGKEIGIFFTREVSAHITQNHEMVWFST